ncbi:MAG: Holliday junction resolvase RuvX [Lachnospiraceae bacterium]|nr:Holliday junction resolvase RuvX [Lachnospiraceae bacterium]
MRILGLDFGDKTIGVAISDPFLMIAQALETIERKNENEFKIPMKRLAEIVEEYDVSEIVLGMPKNMNNTEGDRCKKTLLFKERLERRFPKIKVILWDERLSTVAAEKSLISVGMRRENRKKIIDKMAAHYILQGYLDGRLK